MVALGIVLYRCATDQTGTSMAIHHDSNVKKNGGMVQHRPLLRQCTAFEYHGGEE